jgi:hypothetical protein
MKMDEYNGYVLAEDLIRENRKFINFTNHPSKNWSDVQIAAAKKYGEIIDIPFPAVDPNGDEGYIEKLADTCALQIKAHKPAAVLCQGEMTLAFAIVSKLIHKHYLAVYAACSERVVSETTDENGATVKRAEFKFTRFRKYHQ